MEIKKGHTYLCFAEVVMDDGDIAYKKGRKYQSEHDECITDEQGYKDHRWEDDVEDYFVDVEAIPTCREVSDWMEKSIYALDTNNVRKIDNLDADELRGVIYALYKKLNVMGEVEKNKRMFEVEDDNYDWWDELRVYARNSRNALYENVSKLNKVTIVLYDSTAEGFDENNVSDELIELHKKGIVEDYTLYAESESYLVGYVYRENW